MKKARWISAAIGTAVLTAGFVLPVSAAFADGPSGNGNAGVLSLLSGNDVNAGERADRRLRCRGGPAGRGERRL